MRAARRRKLATERRVSRGEHPEYRQPPMSKHIKRAPVVQLRLPTGRIVPIYVVQCRCGHWWRPSRIVDREECSSCNRYVWVSVYVQGRKAG
jgi:hypothetical protein